MQGDRPPRTNTRFVLGLSSSTAAKQDPCSRSGRTPVPSVGSRPIELGWYGWKASHNSGHFRLRIQLERGGEVIDSHIQKLCIALQQPVEWKRACCASNFSRDTLGRNVNLSCSSCREFRAGISENTRSARTTNREGRVARDGLSPLSLREETGALSWRQYGQPI